MSTVSEVLTALEQLSKRAGTVTETSFRITLEGDCLDDNISALIKDFDDICQQFGSGLSLIIRAGSDSVHTEDLLEGLYHNNSWMVVLPKKDLASALPSDGRDNSNTVFFASTEGFHDWLKAYDPFEFVTGSECDLTQETTIRISGLSQSFGGPSLWVLPADADAPIQQPTAKLPSASEVRELIHINCVPPRQVCPAAFALTWGDLKSPEAKPLVSIGIKVLAASLVQELKFVDDNYEVTLKGTKRLSLALSNESDSFDVLLLEQLTKSVAWLYSERPETRQKLITDRLSIDVDESLTFITELNEYLKAALEQAEDSYDFVILERKDAYHKEMRELMKDMTSQANLYATKIRELINAVSRDFLGILVFFSFSYLARFNKIDIDKLIASEGLSLLGKGLALYLAISCILQIIIHHKDAKMAYEEAEQWTEALRHYTSREEKKEHFLEPIKKRKEMLYRTMYGTVCLYIVLFLGSWNISTVVKHLLHEPSIEPSSFIREPLEKPVQPFAEIDGKNKVVINFLDSDSPPLK